MICHPVTALDGGARLGHVEPLHPPLGAHGEVVQRPLLPLHLAGELEGHGERPGLHDGGRDAELLPPHGVDGDGARGELTLGHGGEVHAAQGARRLGGRAHPGVHGAGPVGDGRGVLEVLGFPGGPGARRCLDGLEGHAAVGTAGLGILGADLRVHGADVGDARGGRLRGVGSARAGSHGVASHESHEAHDEGEPAYENARPSGARAPSWPSRSSTASHPL